MPALHVTAVYVTPSKLIITGRYLVCNSQQTYSYGSLLGTRGTCTYGVEVPHKGGCT